MYQPLEAGKKGRMGMDKENNMVEVATECFLPKCLRETAQVARVQQQEQEEVHLQPSAAPNFAAIAADCFLPKG